MNILIPMAGLASRFANEGYKVPKPLIKVNGLTLIEHTIKTLDLEGRYIFVTRDFGSEDYNAQLSNLLKEICPNCIEIKLNHTTKGSVETCMQALEYIDNDDELIVTNCDQRTEWESSDFLSFVGNEDVDGCVVTYTSENPKNSFCQIDSNDDIAQIVEKRPISDVALIGLHYWKKGKYFVESAKQLIKDLNDLPREPYVSETYNYLIESGLKIKAFHLHNNEYIALGTPEDLTIYQGRLKEYSVEKPKTIFCDIDGTILKHVHRFSDINLDSQPVLNGVIKKFNEWDSQCHRIILCTARKESAREITEKQLKNIGIAWDQLIMGCTNGERLLINDKLSKKSKDRAVGINVITNEGFEDIDWENFGL
jgi:NDP-sugar pyrophosphorylase family protein